MKIINDLDSDRFGSRKLIFALLIIMLAWIVGPQINIEVLKILTGFTEVVFGLYAGANIGQKIASAGFNRQITRKQTSPQTEEIKKNSEMEG